MTEPRAKTVEEVREEFIGALRQIAHYWATTAEGGSVRERCDGVVFSILNIFDGTASNFTAVDLALAPHESDKDFARREGDNWFEPGMVFNDCHLHEMYYTQSPNV